MPDRFANGDPSNDPGGLTGDRMVTGLDPTDKGFYHGGDLAGLMQELDYLDQMGVTAIWMTPVFKNKPVQGEGAAASAGYHGYWITDFTQFDPHFGTNAELTDLITAAHAQRLQGQLYGLGAVAHRHRVVRVERRRQLALEGRALGAQDEPARVQHPRHGRVDLGPDGQEVRPEVSEGDAGHR